MSASTLPQRDFIESLLRETGYDATRLAETASFEGAKAAIDLLVGVREHQRKGQDLKDGTRKAIHARMRELSLTKADLYHVAGVTSLGREGGCTEAQGQALLRHMAGEKVEIKSIDPDAGQTLDQICAEFVGLPRYPRPLGRPGIAPSAPAPKPAPVQAAVAVAPAPAPALARPAPATPRRRPIGRPGLHPPVTVHVDFGFDTVPTPVQAPEAVDDAPDAIPDGVRVPFRVARVRSAVPGSAPHTGEHHDRFL